MPVQRPRPPVWVAVLRNEAAPLVGARGLPVMTIPYAATEQIDELGDVVSAFRTAFVGAGGRVEDATVPFGLHTYCAEDFAQARADAKAAMDRYVRTRLYAKQRPFELLVEKDLIAFGGPDGPHPHRPALREFRAHALPRDHELRRPRPRARAALDGADGHARVVCRRLARG